MAATISQRFFVLLACLFLLSMGAQADSSVDEISKRYKAQWAAEKKEREADQVEVLRELGRYTFPVEESHCPIFMVDWNEISTVQAFMDFSLAYSKKLGNCLHQEATLNVQHFSQYLKKEEVGTIGWFENEVPGSIDRMKSAYNLSANHDRCNYGCFTEVRNLFERAVSSSKTAQTAFLARWDVYVESNIKPALQGIEPAGSEGDSVDARLQIMRMAFEMYSFQFNQPADS